MAPSRSRRTSFLRAAAFALLSIAVLQQTLEIQGPAVQAYLLPGHRIVTQSSSSSSSIRSGRRVSSAKSSSSALHAAAPTLSPRRRSTGSLLSSQPRSSVSNLPIKAGCGDGLLTGSEECDDKNTTAGDGCSASCKVETGFTCASTQPSKCWSTCGDGIVAVGERCDDGNTVSGDGCSSLCKDELGFKCSGSPSVCVIPAYCGNGIIETGEQCDDGNSRQYDGCYLCKTE